MKTGTAVTITVLAGLATTPWLAMGQAITITAPGGGVAAPGETVTVTMSASYGGGDYAIAGLATSLIINQIEGGFSDVRLVAPMDGPGTSAGVLSAGSVDGIISGQLNFPLAGIYADPTNPIAFWEADFTVSDFPSDVVVLDIETRTTRFDVYVDRGSTLSESRMDVLTEGSLRIILPAPGSTLALLGGLALTSRRRR